MSQSFQIVIFRWVNGGPFTPVRLSLLARPDCSSPHCGLGPCRGLIWAPELPKEYPPEPPEEPRREAQASEHRHQADVASLELAGHRLGGAQRHQAGLLDGPAPATEVQGEMG